jgi:uncharacterized membrane protein (GlpM family)
VLKFLLGGAIVSLFAAIASGLKPKTFAGLFGAAPTVALASLGLAFSSDGARFVATLARSMVLGALALLAYSACTKALCRSRLPVLLSAALSWAVWGLAAALLFQGCQRP